MRFALATVTLLAASASASVIFRRQDFPPCANACLASADFGDCPENDDNCLCQSPAFINSLVSCFEQECRGADLTAAEEAGGQICLDAGVTFSDVPTGSATTAVPSPTASGSVSASVTKPAPSNATKPAASSAASVSKPAATSVSGSGSTPASSSGSGSATPKASSRSAGSIVGISSFAGLAAFCLAALTL